MRINYGVTCKKCGLPIRWEAIKKRSSAGAIIRDYVHDNYKEAWQVDSKGYAHNLHFAEPG